MIFGCFDMAIDFLFVIIFSLKVLFSVRILWKRWFLKRSKTPSDIARLLGQLRNYIYRNSVNFQICLNG
jgi:hypothetical protein